MVVRVAVLMLMGVRVVVAVVMLMRVRVVVAVVMFTPMSVVVAVAMLVPVLALLPVAVVFMFVRFVAKPLARRVVPMRVLMLVSMPFVPVGAGFHRFEAVSFGEIGLRHGGFLVRFVV
ncbi:hypothetical protein A6V37_00820 [Paraburkholderia ginsengiterrae]|uniref:Uncharacterized protein n=1 Tax=Paraburkholderia ginsengiterrae TaxID=1462993 RepID=A0A1A9ND47_9BURK|nr:hypothetical protein A6V37_00820 [Paraburkholderia ginsengiterrae]